MNFHEYCFKKAQPVWEKGTERVMNRSIALCTKIAYKGEKVVLALAAHCSFTVLLDGEIITPGPARAGHGYYRADELDLTLGDYGRILLPPEFTLMEIKTDGAMPLWLSHALDELKIYPASFSKYGKAYLNIINSSEVKNDTSF